MTAIGGVEQATAGRNGRRRLLVLCYFFPPLAGGGVHRVLSFVRELPRHGWDCTVICAGRDDYWVSDTTLEARIPKETEVIRVEGGSALSVWRKLGGARGGRRSGATFSWLRAASDWWLLPDSYIGWAHRAARVARRRLERGDVDAVLSSSPPDSVHLAAREARARLDVPWVADFRDPWIGLTFRAPRTGWHRRRLAALERRVLSEADRVLVASRTHAGRIGEATGTRPRVVTHLPNGFEPDPGASPEPPPDASAPGFLAVYTGLMSNVPELETFLEAVHDLLARRPELRRKFRVRLAGPFETGYRDRAVALGLTGIVDFLGPRSHAEARALQRAADLLVLWKPPEIPTMVPGKLYEYLDTGRPLVVILPAGEEAAELAERGGGVRVEPGSREALADELERQVDRRLAAGRVPSARAGWLDDHARPRLAERLARELDAAWAARREGGA